MNNEQASAYETVQHISQPTNEKNELLVFGIEGRARNWLRNAAAIGGVVLAGFAAANYVLGDDSGEVRSYSPAHPREKVIDNDVRMLSWNVYNNLGSKYDDLKVLVDKHNPDIVGLQEVNARDAKGLERHFSDWFIQFVMADRNTKGGYGNVLMSQQEIEDIDSLAMPGNSLESKAKSLPAGFVRDIANLDPSFRQTSDATQERRSAIGGTIEVPTPEGLRKVRFITSHLNGDPKIGPKTNTRQFDEFTEWVLKGDRSNMATVGCVDFNSGQERTVFTFAEHGYIVPITGPTTIPTNANQPGKAIDQCFYKPAETLRLSAVEVLKDPAEGTNRSKSDHSPVLFKRLFSAYERITAQSGGD